MDGIMNLDNKKILKQIHLNVVNIQYRILNIYNSQKIKDIKNKNIGMKKVGIGLKNYKINYHLIGDKVINLEL